MRALAAFPPLYPATVSLLGRLLGGRHILAGTLVSLAAAYLAFRLLQRLAEKRLGSDGARRPLLCLAIFPMTLSPLFLALASLGGRPRVNAAIVSGSTFLLGIAVVPRALWQWVA